MQFDEKDLDKNDDSFSLDDSSNSISWEDLLNDDESVDLNSLIKQGDEQKTTEAKELQSSGDLDISALADDDSDLKDIAKADAGVVQQSVVSEPLALDDALDLSDSSPVANSAASQFNVDDAAKTYVDSLAVEETIVASDDKSAASDIVGGSLSDDDSDLKFVDMGPVQEEDASFSAGANSLLDDEFQDKEISKNVDLSGVVDDELLNLLDNDDDKATAKEDDDDDDILSSAAASTAGMAAASSTVAYSNDTQEDSFDLQNNEDDDDDAYTQTVVKQKKKSPVALLIVLLVIGIIAGVFIGLTSFFGGSNGDITSGDQQYSYNRDDDEGFVSEKEANELLNKVGSKKELKENAEKKAEKVVVSIPIGGRSNPFVPSALFDDNGFSAFGSDLTLPPDVNINSPEVVEARKLFTIAVSGIMYDPVKPSAILRYDGKDYFVQKGDRIDTYTVKLITKEYVTIANGANEYKAYVGESFRTEQADIPASSEMKYNNGSRQYISNNDIQISTK